MKLAGIDKNSLEIAVDVQGQWKSTVHWDTRR